MLGLAEDGAHMAEGNAPGQGKSNILSAPFPIRVLSLAPNPAEVSTRIEFVSSDRVKLDIDVIKLDGTTVMNLFEGDVDPNVPYSYILAVEALETGIYHIRWSTAAGAMTKKIVVAH